MDIFGTADVANSGPSRPEQSGEAPSRAPLVRLAPLDAAPSSEFLPGARLEHLLLAPPRLDGIHARIAMPGLQIDHLRFPAAIALRGHWDPDRVSIVLTVRVNDRWIAGGMPHGSISMSLWNAEAALDAYLPAGTQWVVLSLDQTRLIEETNRLSLNRKLDDLLPGTPLQISTLDAERLARVLQPFLGGELQAADPGMWIARVVLPAFVSALSAAEPRLRPNAVASRRHRLVRRAEAHVRANLFDSIRMDVLSRTVGASERLLEYAFRQMYDMGAIAFLRAVRFNGARKALLAGDPGRTTITQIAMDWGFSHLSEFAGKYRDLFGELPSHTLQRRHSACNPSATPSYDRTGPSHTVKFAPLRYSPVPRPHNLTFDNAAPLTGAKHHTGG